MKLECQRESLKQAVGLTEKVTSKSSSLPVLGFILLSAEGKNLIIRGTNLDLGCEWKLPAKVISPGAVLISGAVFYNLLSNINNVEKLTLEVVNKNLVVSVGSSSTLIKVQSTEDFPTLPELEETMELTLPIIDFVSGARAVGYAAALTDIKPEIASLYFYTDESNAYFVATDSFRLAEKKVDLKTEGDQVVKLIIPVRNVTEILRLLESTTGTAVWKFNRHQLTVITDRLRLTSRLIEGVFPDYRQIMPLNSISQVVLSRVELLNALKLSQIFTDRLNHVTLKLRPEDSVLELTSQNGDVGENTSLVPATINGEELIINLNLRYLLDGLQSISDEKVSLQFNGRTKPILLTSTSDDSFRYLIMPLNR
ncbi:DNA polymerase III subunit beta [Candidatus Nomurabacteria bacterium]|nr:DNA polymerase III subunit beta [Candidatus Nomurabacteria bacterium]